MACLNFGARTVGQIIASPLVMMILSANNDRVLCPLMAISGLFALTTFSNVQTVKALLQLRTNEKPALGYFKTPANDPKQALLP